jgi:putative peptidoglycan lipid II flippase
MSPATTHGSRVVSMASGTMVSRLTGLLRVLVLAWVLGFTPIADSFNLANTVPNMLFDLVLGGRRRRDVHPGLRRATRPRRRAQARGSRSRASSPARSSSSRSRRWSRGSAPRGSSTASPPSITTVTRASTLASSAPSRRSAALVRAADLLLRRDRHRDGAAQHPQPIRRRGSWVPIANNVVCIGVLVWFHLVDPTPTSPRWAAHSTSCGWAWARRWASRCSSSADAVARPRGPVATLVPLRSKGPGPARDRSPGQLDAARRTDQPALALRRPGLRLRHRRATGNSAYTYGWSIMQMPYAVVVVSVLGVLTPQLAGLSTAGLRRARRPAALRPAPVARDHHPLHARPGRLRAADRGDRCCITPTRTKQLSVGTVLAVLAAGLPGFTVFQLCVRGLQSMQRAREVFFLYALENALTIALAIVLGRHSLAGLTASVSIAYSAAAVVALFALARHQVHVASGHLGAPRSSQPLVVAVRHPGHGAALRRSGLDARPRPGDTVSGLLRPESWPTSSSWCWASATLSEGRRDV